jgi:hypothetical protein
MTHPNSPGPRASAVIRVGDHAPALLLGAPVAVPPGPGAAGVILGWTGHGDPVYLQATSLEWLDDLESAVQVARAQGVIESGMTLAVTP